MEEQNSSESPPVSLVKALNMKYSEENCMVDDFAHIYLSSRVKQKTRGQALLPHERREVVTLDCCDISTAGEPGEIGRVCPRVTELDLTSNYIEDWNDVMTILSQLKYLRFLNLCGNPLDDSTYSSDLVSNIFQSGGFTSLTKLVLNNTKVPLSTVQRLLKYFPSLEELHLSLNNYPCVPEYKDLCTTVKRLHFNGNNIKHWEDVERIGKMFSNLETLIIMENPLLNVERRSKDESFLSLKCLYLTKTKLTSWEDIEDLRKFLSLNEVKLIGISLLASYEKDDARRLLVARLPNIGCLNGTPVTSTEREDAERHFIRKFQTSNQPPARYHELVAIHGELDPLAEVNMDARTDYVDVLMHITGRAPRLQSVYLEKTTWQFRKDIADMLQVHVSKILLCYQDKGSMQWSERMIYKNRPLYRYGIKDGDEIFVDVHDSENF